jgi:hypothetical protein
MEVRRAMKVTKVFCCCYLAVVLISLLLGLVAGRLLLDGLALLVVLGVLQLGHNFARVSGRVEVVRVLARLLFAPLLARVSGVDVLFELVVVVLVRVDVVLGHICGTCFAVCVCVVCDWALGSDLAAAGLPVVFISCGGCAAVRATRTLVPPPQPRLFDDTSRCSRTACLFCFWADAIKHSLVHNIALSLNSRWQMGTHAFV